MCRYAFKNYKQTWSCFSCRKSFKKTNLKDYLAQISIGYDAYKKLAYSKSKAKKQDAEVKYGKTAAEIEARYFEDISKCPQCGGQMANVGMDFKSPKTANVKQWNIIASMYKIGAIFQTCGCDGIGYVPVNMPDYEVYLQTTLTLYKNRREGVQRDTALSSFERSERISYWNAKIEKVEREISRAAK